jgi:hypothetical protein
MKLIYWIVGLLAVALAGVHGFFYLATGTIDPCKAAVTRIIQKERAQGGDFVAGVGVLFSEQLENLIRSDGVVTCYRTALTGQTPEVAVSLDKDGLHAGARP